MRSSCRIAAVLALASLPSMALAQAPKECVTRSQVSAMVTSMAPVMLRVARDKCAAMLPAAAYLRGNDSADKLVQFERDSEASKVEAMAGFRLVAGGDLPKGITGATFLTVMSETFAAELTGGLDDRKCAALDDMFASIRTLSGAEAGRFLGNIFALAIGGKKSRTPPSICEV